MVKPDTKNTLVAVCVSAFENTTPLPPLSKVPI